jgi:hypothetical protein
VEQQLGKQEQQVVQQPRLKQPAPEAADELLSLTDKLDELGQTLEERHDAALTEQRSAQAATHLKAVRELVMRRVVRRLGHSVTQRAFRHWAMGARVAGMAERLTGEGEAALAAAVEKQQAEHELFLADLKAAHKDFLGRGAEDPRVVPPQRAAPIAAAAALEDVRHRAPARIDDDDRAVVEARNASAAAARIGASSSIALLLLALTAQHAARRARQAAHHLAPPLEQQHVARLERVHDHLIR